MPPFEDILQAEYPKGGIFMAKYRVPWSEEKIAKYISEGRGSGESKEYKPWLTVRYVPSKVARQGLPGSLSDYINSYGIMKLSVFIVWNLQIM